jgi:pyruvate dehydrogenase E1 component beta subunit/pre-rRNA-processing protein TSR1
VVCPREIEATLDFCKVADIICPILSCKDCDVEKVALDPYDNSHSFDELAY